MVNFLIKRPIAVSMTFLALFIMGLVALLHMPVSLMPGIAIPRITVEASWDNAPAREVEQVVMQPLRRQLMQVSGLSGITTEAREESGTIHMQFRYGSRMDYAFMQVNEKIDRSMNRLPQSMERPRVIRAAANDIPVFYLFLSRPGLQSTLTQKRFMELSRFADQVIKRRLEQIPEVAMADISGQTFPEIAVLPRRQKLQSLQITSRQLIQKVQEANLAVGNLVVRDGRYQYNIRLNTAVSGKEDIGNLLFTVKGQNYRLRELARIKLRPQKREGLITAGQQDAIALAVVKRSGARMADLEKKLRSLVANFHSQYPNTRFTIMRDQTRLLDYSITSVRQTLLLGTALAFLLMFFFLRDRRAPWLIGLAIPASLVVSVLFFYLAGLSINIISLSGLILGIGLMIDNAIIVIDNITQHAAHGANLAQACVRGTNEVIRPLLSAVLTTSAVFLPLIFISGMAGALFYDQAMAITIGLVASFLVSITLLPVYFYRLYRSRPLANIRRRYNKPTAYHRLYERGLFFLLRRQPLVWGMAAILLIVGLILFSTMSKRRLPSITRSDVMLQVDWNEKIHIDENRRRCQKLVQALGDSVEQSAIYAGRQQFLMDLETPGAPQEALLYLKAPYPHQVKGLEQRARRLLAGKYPQAHFSLHPPENLFQMIFRDEQPPLGARIMPLHKKEGLDLQDIHKFTGWVQQALPWFQPRAVPVKSHIKLLLHSERILLYGLSRKQVIDKLRELFNAYRITELTSSSRFTPVMLGETTQSLQGKINRAALTNAGGKNIPLRTLVKPVPGKSLKIRRAGQEGPFYPLHFQVGAKKAQQAKKVLKQLKNKGQGWDIRFYGSLMSNREMMKDIAMILLIAVSLLYFMLAAQFESLALPLIVLVEIPLDIAGALILLGLLGESINIMALIGMIVMTGIIINDSILKIDTINRLHRSGLSPVHAIVKGGQRRLRPILMTSLTTILAMLPFLFISGLSSDLQGPLAIAIIGGMFFGTFVSLYLIPLMYLLLKRRKTTQKASL